MRDFELFAWGLIALAWILFQVIRRVVKPPRPLGTIEEEQPPAPPVAATPQRHVPPDMPRSREPVPAPLDTQWGRAPAPAPVPVATPAPVASEPFRWAVDRAQAELATAREAARRQARARLERAETGPRPRHRLRPSLRTPEDLRKAVVLSAVIGPCRAVEPWQSPQEPG